MMKLDSKLERFFNHVRAAAESRSNIKSMHILKARAIMKILTEEELIEIPRLTDNLNGYEMCVFWGIGIRNPAKDATTIRVAERQIAAAEKEAEMNNE